MEKKKLYGRQIQLYHNYIKYKKQIYQCKTTYYLKETIINNPLKY